eukprot:15342088-Ditylum_brightwellii.AAC.1
MTKHVNYILQNNAEVECAVLQDYTIATEKNGLLEYESPTDYLSAFKTHSLLKLKDKEFIKPFADSMWEKYRSKLRIIKVSPAMITKKLLSGPKLQQPVMVGGPFLACACG